MEAIAIGQKTTDELIDSLLETAWNFGAAFALEQDTTGWASAEESLRVAFKRRIAGLEADKQRLILDVREALSNAEDDHEYMAGKIERLEAENAQLRTQLAQQWTPVGDETLVLFVHPYDSSNNREIDVDGNRIALCGEDEVGDNAYAEIQLPPTLRLCRLLTKCA